ncbi:MAG: hypothetical protein KAG56_00970 [Sulfurovaceae bacterium]|nr:hypothetical protein [Sulfurovaceae bacterium]
MSVHSEFHSKRVDKYHDKVSHWLVDSSNSIDEYLTDSNSSESSKTFAELKTSFAVENTQDVDYGIRLKLRLDLPKIEKELRLIFEDADSDDQLYDGTALNNDYHLEEKEYYLRLDYLKLIKKKLHLRAGAGVRFRKSALHPYLNIKSKYYQHNTQESKVIVSNRFRVYVDGDYENTFATYRFLHLNEALYFTFTNTLRYRSWNEVQKIATNMTFTKSFSNERQASVGLSFINDLNNWSIHSRYYQLHTSYRDKLYGDWMYYEVSPSILRRRENNFDPTFRFMLSIGMKFNAMDIIKD